MTEFYRLLVEKAGLDEHLVHRALDFTKSSDINELSRLFFDKDIPSVEETGVLCFNEAFYPYDFYGKLNCFDLPFQTSSLYIYIRLLEKSFEDFSSRIGDKNIFFETVKKLSESADEYFKDTASDGIYDYRFIANHVRGNMLRLGGFEYQYGNFDGKKAILLHLPDTADLSKESKLKSYRLARQYFGDFPIIADSWILYPEHKKMLSEDSRILDFLDDFDITSTHETTDYSELFHIFGRLNDFSYEKLPKETSLQKAYAERVRKNLPIGSATGILKY